MYTMENRTSHYRETPYWLCGNYHLYHVSTAVTNCPGPQIFLFYSYNILGDIVSLIKQLANDRHVSYNEWLSSPGSDLRNRLVNIYIETST